MGQKRSKTELRSPRWGGWACAATAAALAAVACDTSPRSGYGFTLPPGDAVAGEQHFVALQCTACHTVSGRLDLTHEGERELSVELGGPTPRIATYGELVTSIINPSHRVARDYRMAQADGSIISPMRDYNGVMTVEQLIDLTQFLQDQYELEEPDPTSYPPYVYP